MFVLGGYIYKTAYFNNIPSYLQVVSNEIDVNVENSEQKTYESIYSLLDSVSPGYVQKFGEKLAVKLANLQ